VASRWLPSPALRNIIPPTGHYQLAWTIGHQRRLLVNA
jgi:hypothetical protein